MEKFKQLSILLSALLFAFILFSCDEGSSSENLAKEIVDELGDYLTSQSRSIYGTKAVAFSSDDISSLKSEVLQDLDEAGVMDSDSMDEILPVTVDAVSDFLEAKQTDDTGTLEVICLTTESLVISAGKSERAEKISSASDINTVIGSVAARSIAAVSATVEDPEILADSAGAIVKSAVKTASATEAVSNAATTIETVSVRIVEDVIETCSASEETRDLMNSVVVGVAEAVAETAAEASEDPTAGAIDTDLVETVFKATTDKLAELELDTQINEVLQEVDEYITENETDLGTLGEDIEEAVGGGLLEAVKGRYTFILPDPSDENYSILTNIDWFELSETGFVVSYVDGQYMLTADIEYSDVTDDKVIFILYWTYHPFIDQDYMNIRFSTYDGKHPSYRSFFRIRHIRRRKKPDRCICR